MRLLVTAGLLWVLAARFDLGRAAQLIRGAELPAIAATLVMLSVANLVAACRWQLILSAEATSPGRLTLLKIVLVGLFFNQVLPTGVGGDAVRVWRCSRLGIGLGAAIRSILLDRACGYLVLVVLYIAGLPALLQLLPDARERGGVLALVSLDRLPRAILRLRLIAPFAELSRASRRLFMDPVRCGAALGYSIITIALTILAFKFVGDAVGGRLSLGSWIMIVPPVTLIQLLPVSLAGWRVREMVLVVALGLFGIPAEVALATSLLFGLCLILVGLPGGVIWLTGWDIASHRHPFTQPEAPTPGGLD
jgi:uncharacterized membrane protein YbhN (UPF0104 family)